MNDVVLSNSGAWHLCTVLSGPDQERDVAFGPGGGGRGGYVRMKQLDEISIVEVMNALNPSQDDERLRPKTCQRDPARTFSAHRGLRRLTDRVRQSLAGETSARLPETVCSDLGTSSRETRAELVCVTQGENSP